MNCIARVFLTCTVAFLCGTNSRAQTLPLYRAHAHNDYEHERPLQDALEQGFMSVEADIYLIDGELLVAHDLEDVDPTRTLESLYLTPLKTRVERQGGVVYGGVTEPMILLIDIKSEAESTYGALRERLQAYRSMLTRFTPDSVQPGAVTAIVSGNRPRESMKQEAERWAAYDGRLDDLDADPPETASFIPLVSSNWNAVASWYGRGELPEEHKKKLVGIVKKAHEQGRKLRFWATGDDPAVWEVLYEAGVDLLNADDLEGLQAFLTEKSGKER